MASKGVEGRDRGGMAERERDRERRTHIISTALILSTLVLR